MSLNGLRSSLNEDLLRFLWRQWSQLGVAGDAEYRDSWIIDPEALLLFTLEMGRCDPRLFDEVIDWTVRNGRWISLQRLKNLAESADDEVKRTLAAFASVVDSHDAKRRWRSVSHYPDPVADHDTLFFMDVNGTPLPMIGEPDRHFAGLGFVRPKAVLRGLSMPVPMEPPTNLLFKLRSLFGLAPRAEIAAYLMTHSNGRASVISRSTVYSHPPVHDALGELTSSGLIYAQGRGLFSIDVDRWQRFLEVSSPLPIWVEWPRVFEALSELARFLSESDKMQMSEYLLRSRILTLNESLRDKLSNSGITNPFLRPSNLDEAIETLSDRIRQLMDELNRDRTATPVV